MRQWKASQEIKYINLWIDRSRWAPWGTVPGIPVNRRWRNWDQQIKQSRRSQRQKQSHRGENPREKSFKKETLTNFFTYHHEVKDGEGGRNTYCGNKDVTGDLQKQLLWREGEGSGRNRNGGRRLRNWKVASIRVQWKVIQDMGKLQLWRSNLYRTSPPSHCKQNQTNHVRQLFSGIGQQGAQECNS